MKMIFIIIIANGIAKWMSLKIVHTQDGNE